MARRIELEYIVNKGERLYLEELIEMINSEGGFKKFPQFNDNTRIPLKIRVIHNDSRYRRVLAWPSTLGPYDFEMTIEGELDKTTGTEKVRIPYGICAFHSYLERHGFKTVRV